MQRHRAVHDLFGGDLPALHRAQSSDLRGKRRRRVAASLLPSLLLGGGPLAEQVAGRLLDVRTRRLAPKADREQDRVGGFVQLLPGPHRRAVEVGVLRHAAVRSLHLAHEAEHVVGGRGVAGGEQRARRVIQVARPHLAIADITVVVRRGVAPRPRQRRDDRAWVQLVLGHLDHLDAVEEEGRVPGRRTQLRGVLAPARPVGVEHALRPRVLRRVELRIRRRPARAKRQLGHPRAAGAVELPRERDATGTRLAVPVRERVAVQLVVPISPTEVAGGPLIGHRVAPDRQPQTALAHVSPRAVEESSLAGAGAAQVRHEIAVNAQVRCVADQMRPHHNHGAVRISGNFGDQAELVHRVIDLHGIGGRAIVGDPRARHALRCGVEEKARAICDQEAELAQVVCVDGWIQDIGQRAVRRGEPHVRLAARRGTDRVLVAGGPVVGHDTGGGCDVCGPLRRRPEDDDRHDGEHCNEGASHHHEKMEPAQPLTPPTVSPDLK